MTPTNIATRHAGVLLTALFLATPAAAATISFSPNPVTKSVGEVFTLEVLAADVLDLYGFQFDVTFDPSVVRVNDVLEGDFLSLGGGTFFVPGVINNAAGTVNFTANSLIGPDPGVDGDGVLVRLQLRALGSSAASTVSLQNLVLLDSGLSVIDAEGLSGSVTITGGTAVPEPTPIALLSTGLAALAFRTRRRKLR